MNPIALSIGVVLFITGIVLGRQSLSPSSTIKHITDNLNVFNPPEEVSPTVAIEPTITANPESTPSPITKPENTPLPTPKTVPQKNSLAVFIFPNATITTQSETEIIIESEADSQTISTWYSDRFKGEQYKTLSHAKTNTNGNIVEKFSGNKNNEQIRVTITKKAQEKKITISITSNHADDNTEVRIEIKEQEGYL